MGDGEQYTTPQEAVSQVSDSDTVLIRAGTYELAGSITLTNVNNVVIQGDEGTYLVCNSMTDNVMWIMCCNGVEIRNLHATHADPSEHQSCTGNVFGIDSSSDVIIENCDINGCGAIGVYALFSDSIVLRNNYIHDNTIWAVYYDNEGLLQEDSGHQGLTMEGNTLVNNGQRQTERVISSGRASGQLAAVTNEDGYLVISFTGTPDDGLRVCYVAVGCSGPWLEMLMDPEEYIGKTIDYEWRSVVTYSFPGEYIIEITSMSFPDRG